MKRGEHISHTLNYKRKDNQKRSAGLVAWKDKDIVYALSSESGTIDTDTCRRRTKDGVVTLSRPMMISRYNQYMGGVDVADMKRLHCNSTIMGQNRWWLKLFFYLLDVGTSNALVLYREGAGGKAANMSIVDFKLELLKAFVGPRFRERPGQGSVCEHVALRSEGRHRCSYCAIFSRCCRTRYYCSTCNVALCCPGSGKGGNDCFSLAHENANMLKAVLEKSKAMQKKTNNRNKN